MDLGLKDRVVMISGASRGIGRAVAAAFIAEGGRLAVCSRNGEELRAALQADGLPADRVLPVQADVGRPADTEAFVRAALDRFGAIHVLVNNAGAGLPAAFEELADDRWATVLEQNLWSTIRLTRAVLPAMRAGGGGRVINVSALSGLRPRLGQVGSNVAKAGVVSLTQSLAAELAPHNIQVNAVCPGMVLTSRWIARVERLAREQGISEEEAQNRLAGHGVPLARFGRPDEVAGIILFLASRHAGYITGAAIPVDGGLGACIDLRPRSP
ncbi:MAG: SDR family oxidoreductase [candidate division NC10 bacterium]|nr:SDR family oxidoreductase [candidate division NC10 bacterium]MBI2116812.1 SDR family oxidoreductase [candidate division NC10 bacterium]MBI2458451.1 SDR family oxidoreductase [candidate division NC10 bacterium]MBI2562524.1 SDR family oxidoreductase [candidate division NC10 bacterium]